MAPGQALRKRRRARRSGAGALRTRGRRKGRKAVRVCKRWRPAGEEVAQGAAAAGAGRPWRCMTQALHHVRGAQPMAPLVGGARVGRVHAWIWCYRAPHPAGEAGRLVVTACSCTLPPFWVRASEDAGCSKLEMGRM